MLLSLLPASALADTTEEGYGELLGTVEGDTYTDTTADPEKGYEYTIVGSDGSLQTASVDADDQDGGDQGGQEENPGDTGTETEYGKVTETSGSGETYYSLVTNGAAGIVAGDKYLIVSSNSGNAYALTKTAGSAEVAIADSKIQTIQEAAEFTLEANGNYYYLKDSDGTYLYPASGGIGKGDSTTYTRNPVSIAGEASVKIRQYFYRGEDPNPWPGYYLVFKSQDKAYDTAYSSGNNGNFYLFHKTTEPAGTVYRIEWKEAAGALLTESHNLNRDDYSVTSWAAFVTARETAERVYGRTGTYASQEEAVAALASMTALKTAKEALETVTAVYPEITWSRTLEPKYNATYTQGTNGKLVRNLQYIDHNNTGDYQTISWSDTGVLNLDTDPSMTVWDYNTTSQYSNQSTVGGEGIQAATWNHWPVGTQDWKKADVRKISGTFVWPEGYDLDDTITLVSANDDKYQAIYDYIEEHEGSSARVSNRRIIAINDDMYVYVYKEGDAPTSLADDSYLAFYSGTVGKGIWSDVTRDNDDWGRTEPASYHGKYATRAFHGVYPNQAVSKEGVVAIPNATYLNHTDGWYVSADGATISTVLKNHYGDQSLAGQRIHIDIYCFDNSENGGMDQLKLRLTKAAEQTATVRVEYYLDTLEEGNLLDTSTMTNVPIGEPISLVAGYEVNELNYKKAQAIIKAGNINVSDGVQQGTVPYTVVAGDNVIQVLYTTQNQQAIRIVADSDTLPYDGSEKTVPGFAIYMGQEKLTRREDGTYLTKDGHGIIQNVISTTARGMDPGKYENGITYSSTVLVKDSQGNDITNTYTVTVNNGTLTITYDPQALTYTYDFGIGNRYERVLAGTNNVEKRASGVALDGESADIIFDKEANRVTYTPTAANSGRRVNLTLTFAGNYKVNKSITFLPESNVMYEENLVSTQGEDSSWVQIEDASGQTEGAGDQAGGADGQTEGESGTRLVTDHEIPYGYSDAYAQDTGFSLGSAKKAVLSLDTFTDEATFTFTGTGFDLISECGTNTGLLVVGLKNAQGQGVKGYLVDTYFRGDDTWVTGSGILDYQVPVVRAQDLPFGTYTVTVKGYLTAGSGAAPGSGSDTENEISPASDAGSGRKSSAAASLGAKNVLYAEDADVTSEVSQTTSQEMSQAGSQTTSQEISQAGSQAASQERSQASSQVSVEAILTAAGMEEYLEAGVEVSFMDDNSLLNGGSGPDLGQMAETDSGKTGTDSGKTEEAASTSFFSRFSSFLRNLFAASPRTASQGEGNTGSKGASGQNAASDGAAGTAGAAGAGEIAVYIDAFRVYQPLEGDESYEASERGTSYYSLFDFLKTSINELEGDGIIENAAVYIEYDGSTGTADIANYKDQGPENEVYLAPGASIAFGLVGYQEGDTVQVSAKQLGAGEVTSSIENLASTATEMYYQVEVQKDVDGQLGMDYVVITNDENSQGILSLSALKVSSNITPVASQNLANQVVELVQQAGNAFQPEKMTVTLPESTKIKRSYTLKVATSKDVDYITVQLPGQEETITLNPTNKKAADAGKVRDYSFSKSFKQTQAGSYTYVVTAYDGEGNASQPISVTIQVET